MNPVHNSATSKSASEGSGAFPSLARRVNMQQHAELPCRGNNAGEVACNKPEAQAKGIRKCMLFRSHKPEAQAKGVQKYMSFNALLTG